MIISRSCRFAAVCLMTATLTMSAMSGAIAAADSESDSTSGASEESSSGSGRDATTTTDHNITTTTATGADQPSSTVSAQTYTSASSSDSTDTTSSAGAASEDLSSTDHNVTTTTVSGTGPSSTLSAQTNTSTSTSDSTDTTSASSDDPATTTGVQNQTSSFSAQGDETSSTTTSGSDSATSDAPSESDTAESATLSTPATTETVTSDVVTTNSVAVTEAAAPVAAPTLQYAIAYLLRTLATTAINLVDAILQLPADIRAALGISWATPTVESYRALLLSTTPNVVLLNLIAPSSVPVGSPGAVSAAPTIYRSIEVDGGITLLAAALQPQAAAPAFIAAMRPGHSVTGLIADAVTAVAVTVSIWALVYAALPGLGGLVSFGAVGVRIGYRQSSAGIALLTPDLARFMRPGPIGVVRSGSLIAVHHRTAAADRTTRHIERVA